MQYFKNVPAPFESVTNTNDLEIIKCCYRFLKNDIIYYKTAWMWSNFFKKYYKKYADKNNLEVLFCNKIMALIINLTDTKLNVYNNIRIPIETTIPLEIEMNNEKQLTRLPQEMRSEIENLCCNWTFDNETVFTVEGVTLPIFDINNRKSYIDQIFTNKFDRVVLVQSTKSHLKSLALGISIGRAIICLSGTVGCGKTTLVEYLANETGRVAPKTDLRLIRGENSLKTGAALKQNNCEHIKSGNKRKSNDQAASINTYPIQANLNRNGFLRIQLGDQTDSKMLLGQYRCTDVPGEFIWQAGVLTKVSLIFK